MESTLHTIIVLIINIVIMVIMVVTIISTCKTQHGNFCVCEDLEPSGEAEPEDCSYNCSGEAKNCGGEQTALVFTGEKEICKQKRN